MSSWKTFRKKILSDDEVRGLYDKLEAEFVLVEKIIELRRNKGWTQKELAERLGTTQSALSRIESGRFNPKLDFLKKLADAFESKLVISFK